MGGYLVAPVFEKGNGCREREEVVEGRTGCPEKNKRDGRYNMGTDGVKDLVLLLLVW
jgi:hypothetical protein